MESSWIFLFRNPERFPIWIWKSVFKQSGINGDTTTLKVQTATEISENAMYYFEAERAKKRTSIGNFLKNIFV